MYRIDHKSFLKWIYILATIELGFFHFIFHFHWLFVCFILSSSFWFRHTKPPTPLEFGGKCRTECLNTTYAYDAKKNLIWNMQVLFCLLNYIVSVSISFLSFTYLSADNKYTVSRHSNLPGSHQISTSFFRARKWQQLVASSGDRAHNNLLLISLRYDGLILCKL